MELHISPSRGNLRIGATGMDAIMQNIGIIVSTLHFSVPLDRAFASTGAFIDAPTPYEVARRIAELTEAIEAKEPRVRVTNISFAPDTTTDDMTQGRVFPRISFECKEGLL